MKKSVILTLIIVSLNLISAYQFCDNQTSEDQLEILEIIDHSQENENSWEWQPTQKTNIEVKVKNKNFTQRDFSLELFFLKEDSIKEITQNPLAKEINLDKGETKTLNFSLQLDSPEPGSYFLHAKLIDPSNENICTSQKATSDSDETTIAIEATEKIIVVKKIVGPENISRGSYGIYKVDVANFGNAPEGKVLVIAYNANLNIRQTQEIESLAIDETKSVTFTIDIPENATIQNEKFLFTTEYDYKNETGYYYSSSDDVKVFFIQVNEAKQVNKAQNLPAQEEEVGDKTQGETTSQPKPETQTIGKDETSYFWPIMIILSAIIISITIIVFSYLKFRGESPVPEMKAEESSEKVKEYVNRIRNS